MKTTCESKLDKAWAVYLKETASLELRRQIEKTLADANFKMLVDEMEIMKSHDYREGFWAGFQASIELDKPESHYWEDLHKLGMPKWEQYPPAKR